MCERFHLKVRGLWWRTSKWSLQYIHAFLASHTLRDRSMGTFHGENWPKALSEHGRGGISVILTPNQRFWAFFDYEFFPAELAEGRFQTWIRLVWVVLICGKISDWCWSCSNNARKIDVDPWNISQKYTKSKEIVGQIFIWLKVVHDPVHCGVLSDLFLSRFPLKGWIWRQEETFYSIVSYYH